MSSMEIPTLGQEIQRHLKRLGWAQNTLAQRSGITGSGLSKIIRGRTKPTPHSINAIAQALEVDPMHLMRLAGLPLPDIPQERDPQIEYLVQRLEGLPTMLREEGIRLVATQLDVLYHAWEREQAWEQKYEALKAGEEE